LEWFDRTAVEVIRSYHPDIPPEAVCAIWCEQECSRSGYDGAVEAWVDVLGRHGALVNDTLFAGTPEEKAHLAEVRHALPTRSNEFVARTGLSRISTDCSVPSRHLEAILDEYRQAPLEHMLYGHIGDDHLHLNLLPGTGSESEKAREFSQSICRKVVGYGGSVSAEHGIGTLKTDYLKMMVGDKVVAQFRALKAHLDPKGILNRGVMFPA